MKLELSQVQMRKSTQMPNIFKRLKNLWELSNFVITEFDNKSVITKENEKLVVTEKPRLAQIIKMSSPVEDFMKNAND